MRVQGAALSLLLLGLLTGCTPSSSGSTPDPTSPAAATDSAEVVPVGSSTIPLDCADLLDGSAVADLGPDDDEPIEPAIDASTIVVAMSDVAALQAGQLHCIWAARYGATDFHAQIEVRISPTDATTLDPGNEESYGDEPLAPFGSDPATLLWCSEPFAPTEDSAQFNTCEVVQLRRGYRITIEAIGLEAGPGRDSSVAADLLEAIDAAVDAAGGPRTIETVTGAADPASLCTGPEIAPVLQRLGAVGDPLVETYGNDPVVTTCEWSGVDENGNPTGPTVEVLPGGAWAIPRLRTGIASIFLPTHPSTDGSLIIGVGDGVSAWRAIGGDLVSITSWDYDAVDGWESFIEATW
jgi:hypothetical protein